MTATLAKAVSAALDAIAGADDVGDDEMALAIRAALKAIREPSDAVLANETARFMGFIQNGDEPEDNAYAEPDEARYLFRAMIDAILNEKPAS